MTKRKLDEISQSNIEEEKKEEKKEEKASDTSQQVAVSSQSSITNYDSYLQSFSNSLSQLLTKAKASFQGNDINRATRTAGQSMIDSYQFTNETVNKQNKDGDTILHIVLNGCINKEFSSAKLFHKIITLGGRIDIPNKSGQTAYDLFVNLVAQSSSKKAHFRTNDKEINDFLIEFRRATKLLQCPIIYENAKRAQEILEKFVTSKNIPTTGSEQQNTAENSAGITQKPVDKVFEEAVVLHSNHKSDNPNNISARTDLNMKLPNSNSANNNSNQSLINSNGSNISNKADDIHDQRILELIKNGSSINYVKMICDFYNRDSSQATVTDQDMNDEYKKKLLLDLELLVVSLEYDIQEQKNIINSEMIIKKLEDIDIYCRLIGKSQKVLLGESLDKKIKELPLPDTLTQKVEQIIKLSDIGKLKEQLSKAFENHIKEEFSHNNCLQAYNKCIELLRQKNIDTRYFFNKDLIQKLSQYCDVNSFFEKTTHIIADALNLDDPVTINNHQSAESYFSNLIFINCNKNLLLKIYEFHKTYHSQQFLSQATVTAIMSYDDQTNTNVSSTHALTYSSYESDAMELHPTQFIGDNNLY